MSSKLQPSKAFVIPEQFRHLCNRSINAILKAYSVPFQALKRFGVEIHNKGIKWLKIHFYEVARINMNGIITPRNVYKPYSEPKTLQGILICLKGANCLISHYKHFYLVVKVPKSTLPELNRHKSTRNAGRGSMSHPLNFPFCLYAKICRAVLYTYNLLCE